MDNRIKSYVRQLMKGYKISDKRLEGEIISACCDEYRMQLEGGASAECAYAAAVADVEGILKDKSAPVNKYRFSLIVCICMLAVAVIEIIVPWLSAQPLEIYGFEMPIAIIALSAVLIFMIIKRRERYWYDFVIVALFLALQIASFVQICPYAYHATMPDRYWSAKYIFPCIIKILTYMSDSLLEVNYELTSTAYAYDFCLLASIILLIVMLALIINNKIKLRGENK